MELTVAKKDLLKIVARMQGVAERKSTMPVLANVLLAADGTSALRLAATDLYLSLMGRIPAEISRPGSVAVSAKDLFERVKMMPDGPVVIAAQDNATTTLKASGTARRYTLRGMPGDDFPPLPQPAEGAPTLALDVDVLAELIAKTHFSISTDETRAHLNSALFEWDGDVVRMVTTDGHRLSKVDVKVVGRQASATMLIPLKAVSVAASERTGGVKLTLTKGSMRITSESPESGDGFDEIPVEFNGPNMSIGFNAKYFLDVLGAVGDEEVAIGLSGELDPAVLRPAGATTSSDRQFLSVVMPMRI